VAEPVIVTAAGKAKIEAELDELVNVRRPAVLLRIRDAKSLGDLRENFDFHDAKREQRLSDPEGLGFEFDDEQEQDHQPGTHERRHDDAQGLAIEQPPEQCRPDAVLEDHARPGGDNRADREEGHANDEQHGRSPFTPWRRGPEMPHGVVRPALNRASEETRPSGKRGSRTGVAGTPCRHNAPHRAGRPVRSSPASAAPPGAIRPAALCNP
jgi:hypothetical protein